MTSKGFNGNGNHYPPYHIVPAEIHNGVLYTPDHLIKSNGHYVLIRNITDGHRHISMVERTVWKDALDSMRPRVELAASGLSFPLEDLVGCQIRIPEYLLRSVGLTPTQTIVLGVIDPEIRFNILKPEEAFIQDEFLPGRPKHRITPDDLEALAHYTKIKSQHNNPPSQSRQYSQSS